MPSLSERIASHLPFLRRYARAVTGSQTSGDAYVAAMLEALIADVDAFPEASSDRVALYKLFAAMFDTTSISVEPAESPFKWERRAVTNLASVPPKARQAFLLTSVEAFSTEEVAEILAVKHADVGNLITEAGKEIANQVVTDVLIIEDEPLIAMDIEAIVQELGHRVAGIARTKGEAVALFRDRSPKMVLADIQLADGSSGIDAVNEMLRDSDIPVIFITAFPERLLTGERPEPTFLVTKPFDPDMVKALISQALFFDERSSRAA